MNKRTLTPSMLRIILSVVLVLLLSLGVGVFILGYQRLKIVNTDAQSVAAKAQESQSGLSKLMTTKKLLEEKSTTVNRADQLVSQSRSYVYQDQIISDINKYATEAGIAITDITFTDAKTTAVTSSASNTAPSANGSAATASAAPATPAGIKSMTAQITIKSPTGYDAMLTFTHLVEQSLFRMQISQVSLSRDDSTGGISSDALTIEVFVR